jgi:predicted NAD/FAD-binding protein
VVLATAAPRALALLAAPTADERRLLGPLATSENRTVLHGDVGSCRGRRDAWASWNYVGGAGPARITYWMNRLHGPAHRAAVPGHAQPVAAAGAGPHTRRVFHHPQFDFAALDAHAALPRLQGAARTYFAGAWTGFGFHEDGLRSGQVAAARLLADEGA